MSRDIRTVSARLSPERGVAMVASALAVPLPEFNPAGFGVIKDDGMGMKEAASQINTAGRNDQSFSPGALNAGACTHG